MADRSPMVSLLAVLLLVQTASATHFFTYLGGVVCANESAGCNVGTIGQSYSVAPSYAMAIANSTSQNDLNNLQLNYDVYNTIERMPNDYTNDFKAALNLLSNPSTVGLMGFDSTCAQIIRLAQAFNTLAVSTSCDFNPDTNDATHDTLLQFTPGTTAQYKALLGLLKSFGWNDIVLAFFNSYQDDGSASLILQSNGINVVESTHISATLQSTAEVAPLLNLIMRTYLKTRIYILLESDNTGRLSKLFLDVMSRAGLLQTGEYFVITFTTDLNIDSWTQNPSYFFYPTMYPQEWRAVPDMQYMEQFRSHAFLAELPIMEGESEDWTNFVNELRNEYSSPSCPPLCSYNGAVVASLPYEYFPSWKTIARAYDAARVVSDGFTTALENNMDITNGTSMKQLMINKSFKSATGRTIVLNQKGIADVEMALIAPRDVPTCPTCSYLSRQLYSTAKMIPGMSGQYSFQWVNATEYNFYMQFLGGKPPLGRPKCGFTGELCANKVTDYNKYYMAGAIVVVLLAVILVIIVIYKMIRYERELANMKWKIPSTEIELKNIQPRSSVVRSSVYSNAGNEEQSNAANGVSLTNYFDKLNESNGPKATRTLFKNRKAKQAFKDSGDEWSKIENWKLGKYGRDLVAAKKVDSDNVKLTRDLKKELMQVTAARNDYINNILGIVYEPPKIFVISDYAERNSLKEVLENPDLRLERIFIVAFIMDIVRGLKYLHRSPIGFHGNLKSTNCFVDATWRVRIGNFGMLRLRENESVKDESELFWTAPEILRSGMKKLSFTKEGLVKGDVYSFGIILYEIYARKTPYSDEVLLPKEIVDQIKFPVNSNYVRPNLDAIKEAPSAARMTSMLCWSENPAERPDMSKVRRMLDPIATGIKTNLADNIMMLLDRYKNNLEDVVRERTADLEEEHMRCERLILRMLPAPVAHALKNGEKVKPEYYDSVTIYFSDIVGFTALSSQSTPMEVIELLNDLYTMFDKIIDDFDIYKVETIGDAYMIASGVPELNGLNHAGEVASAALRLLQSVHTFKIRHRPNESLKLRIGLHSGMCLAGVVGVKMPRYCLFGPTVMTCSSMEQKGEPLKIHCSKILKELLEEHGGYTLEERGYVDFPRRGRELTYWLTGNDPAVRKERLEQESRHYPHLRKFLNAFYE